MMDEAIGRPRAFETLADALKGIVDSQYRLAIILEEEEKDVELACGWYQKAALQGHTEAAYRCGMLCLESPGERQLEASYWLAIAADKGHPAAQYHLALAYESGSGGVNIDPEQALRWHRIAARLGHAEARARLEGMDSWLSH